MDKKAHYNLSRIRGTFLKGLYAFKTQLVKLVALVIKQGYQYLYLRHSGVLTTSWFEMGPSCGKRVLPYKKSSSRFSRDSSKYSVSVKNWCNWEGGFLHDSV